MISGVEPGVVIVDVEDEDGDNVVTGGDGESGVCIRIGSIGRFFRRTGVRYPTVPVV
jgi:hypothetical protein